MQAHVGGGEARGCLTLGENKSWVAASWCSPGGHLQATVSSSDTTCHPGGHSLVHRTLPEGVPLGTTTPTTDSGTLAGLGLLWPQEGGVNSQGGSLLKLPKVGPLSTPQVERWANRGLKGVTSCLQSQRDWFPDPGSHGVRRWEHHRPQGRKRKGERPFLPHHPELESNQPSARHLP